MTTTKQDRPEKTGWSGTLDQLGSYLANAKTSKNL